MLRPSHTILGLALLVAMLGNSWGQSPATSGWLPAQTPQTDQRGTEQAPVVVKVLPAAEGEKQATANAKREEQKAANDERLTLYTGRLFLATVVLSLIAFFQLLVFGWQGYQLRRSVDVLSQAERAQMFVVVGEHNLPDAVKVFTMWPNSPTMHVGPIQSGIYVSYTFKNYGKTPAILREISSRLVYFKKLPTDPYYIASDAILKEYMLAPNDTIVLPHCRLEDMTKEDARTVVHAYSYIWFYGRIVYDDSFGKRHEHRFLWRYGGAHGFRPNYEHKQYVKNT